MADMPAAIGIRLRFVILGSFALQPFAAMLLLPSTSWRPATAAAAVGCLFFSFGEVCFCLIARGFISGCDCCNPD